MSPPLHLYNKLNILVQNAYRISFFVVLMLGTTAHAKDSPVSMNNTRFSSSVSSPSSVTSSQEQLAKMYDMDMQQWRQYKQEMLGPRSLWSPNLHPLLVIGMRKGVTDSERQRIARQYAKIQFQRIQRELAMEKAVRQATLELYPHVPLFIDNPRSQPIKTTTSGQKTRVEYFAKPGCKDQCRHRITKWISDGQNLDLYVVGNKKQTIQFAKSMGISPLLVPNKIRLIPLDKKTLIEHGVQLNQLPLARNKP